MSSGLHSLVFVVAAVAAFSLTSLILLSTSMARTKSYEDKNLVREKDSIDLSYILYMSPVG